MFLLRRQLTERRDGARGYVLVETLVSMALLSICMLVIYRTMRDAALMRGLAEDFTTARFLLEETATDQELQLELAEGNGAGVYPAPNERFSYSWSITRVPVPMRGLPSNIDAAQLADLEKDFKKFMGRLTVRVRWSRAGTAHEVIGETLLRPGQLWTPPEAVQP